MASQIAHIVYTDKLFKKLDSGGIKDFKYPIGKIDRDEFMLGAVFPDIRRIDGGIKRRETHMFFSEVDLNFEGLSSFQAGWKYHLYCDMRREEILNKYKFYNLPDAAEFYNQPAKNLEDELVYDEYDNWEKLVNYFNHPPAVNIGLELDNGSFQLWYAIIAKYISSKPTNKSTRAFLIKQPSYHEKINEIMAIVEKLRMNLEVCKILLKVKDEIV